MNLTVTCPINTLGYGVVGNNICLELQKRRSISVVPIGPVEFTSEEIQFSSPQPGPSLVIYHQHALNHDKSATYKIGWPIFELNRFTQDELSSMSAQDCIIVCSQWAKDVLNDNGLNSHVIPLGFDPTIFFPAKHTQSGPVRFFNIGKWEIRKGHDFLIKAWKNAFGDSKDVELNMCCSNPFLKPWETNRWEKIYQGDNIKIWPRLNSHLDVADFIRTMDVGVFPSRAEGFNLEALETLACGKKLICTDYSAHREFAHHNLISVDKLEPAVDNKWFYGQGEWASLGNNQMEQTVHLLRDYANLKSENTNLTWSHSVDLLERFFEKYVPS